MSLGLMIFLGKHIEDTKTLFKKIPKQKIIAEGKVHYQSTMKGSKAWIGKKDDGFAVKGKLVSKLYRYRGKNIKLIVEIVKKEK